jgi:hypothetical protein
MGAGVHPFIGFHPLRQSEVARLAVPGYNRVQVMYVGGELPLFEQHEV